MKCYQLQVSVNLRDTVQVLEDGGWEDGPS